MTDRLKEPEGVTAELLSPSSPQIPTLPVENQDNPDALTAGYRDSLKAYDNGTGSSLWEVWESCQKFNSEHEMLRVNIRQMQVMIQDLYQRDVKLMLRLEAALKDMKAAGGPGEDPALTAKVAALSEAMSSGRAEIDKLTKTSLRLAREIRAAEYQQRYWYHANIIQQFMAGMTGILMQELRSTDKVQPIVNKMGALAGMLDGSNDQVSD